MSDQPGNGPQDPNAPRDPSQDPGAQQTPPEASEGEKPFYMRPMVLAGAGVAVVAIIAAVAFMGPSGKSASDPAASVDEDQLAQAPMDNQAGAATTWELGRPGDIVMGDPNAPVKMVEYASLTCGHCANFKLTVFPDIKKKYIDTGLVQYTLREFPTPPVSLSVAAFMLARCAGEDRYYSALEALFRTQPLWVKGNPQEARAQLEKISRQFGLNEDDFETCVGNEQELQRIRTVVQAGQDVYGINSTPSFVINGTKANIHGATFEALDSVIRERLPEGTEVPEYTPTGYSPPEGESGEAEEGEETADDSGDADEATAEEADEGTSEEGTSEEGSSEEGKSDEGAAAGETKEGDAKATKSEDAAKEEGASEEGTEEESDAGADGESTDDTADDSADGGEGDEPSDQ